MIDDAVAEPLAEAILAGSDPVRAAREGLPLRALDRVSAAIFGGPRTAPETETLARALGVSARTMARRGSRGAAPLPPQESDRLLLLAETYDLAVQALGSDGRARAWLRRPHQLMGGEPPVARLDTLAGVREVQTALYHIEFGMPA